MAMESATEAFLGHLALVTHRPTFSHGSLDSLTKSV